MAKTEFKRLIVCAAIRHKDTGLVICGVRHGNCLNLAIRLKVDETPSNTRWEFGFVDQHNEFLNRDEAWGVADAAGQIRRPHGFERNYDAHRRPDVKDPGALFSENLY